MIVVMMMRALVVKSVMRRTCDDKQRCLRAGYYASASSVPATPEESTGAEDPQAVGSSQRMNHSWVCQGAKPDRHEGAEEDDDKVHQSEKHNDKPRHVPMTALRALHPGSSSR